MDGYDHSNWAAIDIDRNEEAMQAAHEAGLLKKHGGFEILLRKNYKGSLKVIKKVLTRAPVARSKGIWYLAEPYYNVFRDLEEHGYRCYIIFVDAEEGILAELPLEEAMRGAKLTLGRGGEGSIECPDCFILRPKL